MHGELSDLLHWTVNFFSGQRYGEKKKKKKKIIYILVRINTFCKNLFVRIYILFYFYTINCDF